MELRVGRLGADSIRTAVSVLCQAFATDPVFSHYFPQRLDRDRVFSLIFSDLIVANRRFGSVYAAHEGFELSAAAIWRAPHATTSLWDGARSAIAQHRMRRVSRDAAKQLSSGFAALEQLHPSEPHWYLAFVGVAPHRQGAGVGVRLLRPVLDVASAGGQSCYLETPFPQTHAFYRSLGFEIIEECSPFLGAPPVWRMIRRPSS
jgi:GNAT superfamily N-acetyltransferase